MKHIIQYFIISLLILLSPQLFGQEFINKTLPTNSINKVLVSNIFGNVTVIGTDNNEIKLNGKLVSGKQVKELFLDVVQKEDLLIIYMKGVCSNIENETFDPNNPLRIIGNSNNCNNNPGPNFTFPTIDLTLEVPKKMESYISTVNEGDIVVDDVLGKLWVSNVNGNITLNTVDKLSKAITVNGDIDVSFVSNPKLASCYKTINGDITINSTKLVHNEVKFKSFSGDLYTDSDEVKVSSGSNNSKTHDGALKIENYELITLGNGGPLLSIETFNGNAYIQKIK